MYVLSVDFRSLCVLSGPILELPLASIVEVLPGFCIKGEHFHWRDRARGEEQDGFTSPCVPGHIGQGLCRYVSIAIYLLFNSLLLLSIN